MAISGCIVSDKDKARKADVADKITSSALLLDVRTPEEFATGHLEGAINISHDSIASNVAMIEQYKDKEILVYCRSGRRSAIAIESLKQLGFTALTDGGGYSDLVANR